VSDLGAARSARLRARIDEERRRTAARVGALEREHADIVESSADAVRDDEHDPEGPTIAYERAQVAALLAGARSRLLALDAAARRLEGPDAGRCARCGAIIAFERLLARPAATRCVRCAGAS
jgi:DnaK suppressor protein